MSREPKFAAPLLVFLFAFSGFLGLVYEVLWIRKLTLVFGASALAMSTVLAAFFGGMALGSYVFGRLAQRVRNPVRLYAALEVGVGAFALAFPELLRMTDWLYGLAYAELSQYPSWLHAYRVLLGGVLLLIPTALMGGSLPVMSQYFVQKSSQLSARIGGLYAVNTLGAALGALVTGYFLIARLGVDSTTLLAGSCNIGLGLAAWYLGGRAVTPALGSSAKSRRKRSQEKQAELAVPSFSPRLTLFVTLAFGVSGFISIAYEIIWTRYLGLFLTNSIYAASTILSTFLVGLGLGSLIFARFLGKQKRPLTTFGVLQLGIGGSAVLLMPALLSLDSPLAMSTPQFIAFQVFCFALMILPTTLMGALLPLVCRIVVQGVDKVGRSVGAVYAVNTVGAVLGALVGGLLLAPGLGIGGSIALLATANGLIGLAAFAFEPSPRRWQVSIGGMVALAIVAVPALLWPPIPLARLAQIAGPSDQIIDLREGLMGTVWVTENRWHERSLWVGTSVMGRTQRPGRQGYSAQRVQGHIPLLLHRGGARTVLGIGFGTGQTFGAQLQHPIERLDAVDISRAVVELGVDHFREEMSGFDSDPRARLIVDDGRSYVTRTRETYDVITLEMPPHTEVGIVHFYTLDFYELLRRRLRPGGLVSQWLPIYNLTPTETRGVVRTFIEVFPEAALWYNSTNLLLLGWEDAFLIQPSSVAERLRQPAIAQDLAISYTGDPSVSMQELEAVLAGFLMGPTALAKFAQEAPLYTDDEPGLEFSWVEFPVRGPVRSDLLILENARQIAPLLDGIASHLSEPLGASTLERILDIRRSYVGHLFAMGYDNLATRSAARGLVDEAERLYGQAISAQPWFAQAHYNLGNLYMKLGKAEEALEVHQRAARLAPDLAEAQFAIGFALHELGRLQASAEAYRAAIAIHPDFADAYLNLARVEFERKLSDQAISAIRALLARDPGHAEGQRLLAELLVPTPQ